MSTFVSLRLFDLLLSTISLFAGIINFFFMWGDGGFEKYKPDIRTQLIHQSENNNFFEFLLFYIIESFHKSTSFLLSLIFVLFHAFCYYLTEKINKKYKNGNKTHHHIRSEFGVVDEQIVEEATV